MSRRKSAQHVALLRINVGLQTKFKFVEQMVAGVLWAYGIRMGDSGRDLGMGVRYALRLVKRDDSFLATSRSSVVISVPVTAYPLRESSIDIRRAPQPTSRTLLGGIIKRRIISFSHSVAPQSRAPSS